MRKEQGFYVIIIMIFIVLGVVFYAMSSEVTNLELIAETRNEKIVNLTYKYNELAQDVLLGFRMKKDTNLVSDLGVIYNYGGPTQSYLVLRVHEKDCNDCVRASLAMLDTFEEKLNYKVVIMANYPTIASLNRDIPNIKYPVALVDNVDTDRDTDVDHGSKPYYFTVTNGHVDDIFFPNSRMMEVFYQYLEFLSETSELPKGNVSQR